MLYYNSRINLPAMEVINKHLREAEQKLKTETDVYEFEYADRKYGIIKKGDDYLLSEIIKPVKTRYKCESCKLKFEVEKSPEKCVHCGSATIITDVVKNIK